jgi:ketosteroid isomerase-like protein
MDERMHKDAARLVEHTFHAWDEALGAKDIDAAMALYHPDATLESPLVSHLRGTDEGIVRGRTDLRAFVADVFAHQPPQRRRFRLGYLSDGERVTWEYPRESPDGEQMDIVEVMELRDGLIVRHRVYWGWYSVRMLTRGEHPR